MAVGNLAAFRYQPTAGFPPSPAVVPATPGFFHKPLSLCSTLAIGRFGSTSGTCTSYRLCSPTNSDMFCSNTLNVLPWRRINPSWKSRETLATWVTASLFVTVTQQEEPKKDCFQIPVREGGSQGSRKTNSRTPRGKKALAYL